MSSQKSVPFFDYPRVYKDHRDDLIGIFDDVCSRGAFILQKDVYRFEEALAAFTNASHAVGVGNATDGLELAWMAIGLKPGDEVIFCSHTMVATASAIKTAGGVPVPVELGDDGLIDPDAAEAAITSNTVGIMPTQLNGRVCNMDRLMQIKEKYALAMIEDSAQALGAKFKGQCAGTFGEAGAISFFPAKVLGSLGDGGGVLCKNEEIFDKIYQLHEHGRDVYGELKSWGRNSRLDNLQAAFLQYNLGKYEAVIERRRTIAALYEESLGSLAELKLPPGPNAESTHYDIYQNYELQADRRDELRDYLKENGIGTLVQWGGKAVHQWEALGFTERLPKTDLFFERCIMLPMNMFVSNEDVHYVCENVHEFYRK